jgi:threonylcarbamoyladenosine tRNA methylthiotransferase MtaB
VRRLRPDIAVGADIIAGFPTGRKRCSRARRLVEECGLTFLHVFPYSKRPRHTAARIAAGRGGEIRERAKRLRRAARRRYASGWNSEIGADARGLIESAQPAAPSTFVPVAIAGEMPGR